MIDRWLYVDRNQGMTNPTPSLYSRVEAVRFWQSQVFIRLLLAYCPIDIHFVPLLLSYRGDVLGR